MSELLEADLLDAVVDAVCEEYTSSKEVLTGHGGFFLGTKENGFWKKVLAGEQHRGGAEASWNLNTKASSGQVAQHLQ